MADATVAAQLRWLVVSILNYGPSLGTLSIEGHLMQDTHTGDVMSVGSFLSSTPKALEKKQLQHQLRAS